jgi:hypothetical protein
MKGHDAIRKPGRDVQGLQDQIGTTHVVHRTSGKSPAKTHLGSTQASYKTRQWPISLPGSRRISEQLAGQLGNLEEQAAPRVLVGTLPQRRDGSAAEVTVEAGLGCNLPVEARSGTWGAERPDRPEQRNWMN